MNERKKREQIERAAVEFAMQLVEILAPEPGRIRGLYASPEELSEEFSISVSTVSRITSLIRDHMSERYADDAVIELGANKYRVRRDCFKDAIKNRRMIERGIAGRPDPEITRAR